ncbi:guanine nucleotide-binding protein alpha-16 subunit [Acrasis kona]|uniref:Guanine nucleotide-binding protein alpha-16 subunit n=1 Tax=Acrasis kona TaxID=1008807 RepID=A0AAW2ZN35_9EUKA
MGNVGSLGDEHEINKLFDDPKFDTKKARDIVAAYKKIIKNKEGLVGREEFYEIIGSEPSLFIDRIFDLFDLNKTGLIDIQEFANGISSVLHGNNTLQKLKIYDIDGDGFISKSELSKLLSATYIDDLNEKDLEKEVQEWFDRADRNKDGKISFEEFKVLIGEHPLLISDVTTQKKVDSERLIPEILSIPLIGHKPTILLLGTGDAGKSSLYKILRKHASEEASVKNEFYTGIIKQSIILWMLEVCDAAKRLNTPMKDQEAVHRLMNERRQLVDLRRGWDEQCKKDIVDLFESETFKTLYARSNEFQFPESLRYFVYNLDRICASDYEPTFADLMRTKVKTTGIVTSNVYVEGREVVLMDTGGQVNERRKWHNCFETNVTVVYVASLTAYSLEMYEDYRTNRFFDCLNCFKSCVNDPRLKGCRFVLVLNKKDLLPKALRQKPFKDVVPSYTRREEEQYMSQIDSSSRVDLTIKVASLFGKLFFVVFAKLFKDTNASWKLYDEIMDVALHNKHRQDMVGWKDLFKKQ